MSTATQNTPNGNGLKQAYTGIFILAIMLILLCMMSSCRSIRYVPVPEYHTDSIFISKVRHDSLYIRDTVSTVVKGDTVLIYKERLKEKYLTLTDTIYKERTDSVFVPYEVVKEKKLTWIQRLQIETWPILSLLILAAVGYFALKRFLSKWG